MNPTRIGITMTACCCAVLVFTSSHGQESRQAAADGERTLVADEEIVIYGRSQAVLREQLRLAEEAVYERFNEINSNDEFDIHCYHEPLTGSRIPRRVCQPNFLRAAQAAAGQETVRALQGGPALDPLSFQAEALHKRHLLAEEMRRLALEDERLGQGLVRVANLHSELAGTSPPGSSAPPTSARQMGHDGDALSYGASSIAEVRIGREPWNHVLTERTFAIAQVFGEIRAIEVECEAGRAEQLQWERGVEWTLPDDWGRCTLLVRAVPRTTFALYEFE